MIEWADKNFPANSFRRDMDITRIRLAFRIMEYFAPSGYIPTSPLDPKVKNLLLLKDFATAYEKIEDDDFGGFDFGCSSTYETLKNHAIELMGWILPIYLKSTSNAKEKRRAQLLDELANLDKVEE